MKRRINSLNETIERMKSLFTEERMFGNLVVEEKSSKKDEDEDSEESASAKPECCTSCNCWADCGGEDYYDGTNGKPEIVIDKSEDYFSISYDGKTSGHLIKHGKCGSGDSIHQTCNVLTYEINKYLKGKKLKPIIEDIDFVRDGGEFSIGVPLEPSDKSYKLERRGGMGHDPGPSSVKSEYGSRSGFEGPVKHSSGGITEYFVTFYE